MRDPAPPYAGEGPHALWHVSEDDAVTRFVPRHRAEHDADESLVWAIDTRHLPLYWFPRECPRATFWAHSGTTDEDVERFLGGDRARRVHVIEPSRLDLMRTTQLFAYRLPGESFEAYERAGGYWVSREAVEPSEIVALPDLVELHENAAIELRPEPRLLQLWDEVVVSTLEFSGIRLRNVRLVS